MPVTFVTLRTVPAPLILANFALHMRAAAIFTNHDTALGAWSRCEHEIDRVTDFLEGRNLIAEYRV